MDKVRLTNIRTGVTWQVRWQDFIDGVAPRSEEAKKRMSSTLDDKKRMAAYLGYELLETENFSVKKRVKLKIKNTQEIVELTWEPIQSRYRRKLRALKQSGIDL